MAELGNIVASFWINESDIKNGEQYSTLIIFLRNNLIKYYFIYDNI